MRADALEKIGSIREYVRKPEEERQQINTREPSVRQACCEDRDTVEPGFPENGGRASARCDSVRTAPARAISLEHDAQVKQEIEAQLTLRGAERPRPGLLRQEVCGQLFESTDSRLEAKKLERDAGFSARRSSARRSKNTQVEVLKNFGARRWHCAHDWRRSRGADR